MPMAGPSSIKLQWGRAYKSAEFNELLRANPRKRLLQWGRAYKSAELTMTLLQPCWLQKLQWGRAYKSAEFLISLLLKSALMLLQWGRAYKSAEFHNLYSSITQGYRASMGPRLQERGVPLQADQASWQGQSFNGAALTRARS